MKFEKKFGGGPILSGENRKNFGIHVRCRKGHPNQPSSPILRGPADPPRSISCPRQCLAPMSGLNRKRVTNRIA